MTILTLLGIILAKAAPKAKSETAACKSNIMKTVPSKTGQISNQAKTSSRGITLSKSILPAETNLAIAKARALVVKASLPTSNSMV